MPAWLGFVSVLSSFSERYTRSRITRSYVFHQARFVRKLERLEQVLARRVPLSPVDNRIGRKVREPIKRFVLVVKEDLWALLRVFPKQVPESHSSVSLRSVESRDDWWLW